MHGFTHAHTATGGDAGCRVPRRYRLTLIHGRTGLPRRSARGQLSRPGMSRPTLRRGHCRLYSTMFTYLVSCCGQEAARAGQQRQQVLSHETGDAHVPDVRPPRPRAMQHGVQPGPAPGTFRRRRYLGPLVRVQIPRQPRAGMPGLATALTVLAAFPLRGLPLLRALGPEPLPCPDRILRRRRPRDRAVLAKTAFQLRDLQLQPPELLPDSLQLAPQHADLGVLGLDDSPQPGNQRTLIPAASRHARRIIGHKPRSFSTSTKDSTTTHRVSRHALNREPLNGHVRSWIALTSDNYYGVITAAQAGKESAWHHPERMRLK